MRLLLLLLCAGLWCACETQAAAPPDTSEASAAVRQLIRTLADADPSRRAEAACALGRKGHTAVAAVPFLVRLMDDPTPVAWTGCRNGHHGWWSRKHRGEVYRTALGRLAASALTDIADGAPNPVETALMEALQNGPDLTRAHAAWAMGAMDHGPAFLHLTRLLRNDGYAYAREQAAWALGAMDSHDGIPALTEALNDPHASVREQAAWALGAIGSKEGVPGLMRVFQDADADVREQAAWALGAIGSSDGVPGLTRLLKDETPDVREQAAWALGAIGSKAGVDALVNALKDENPDVREQAAWALGVIGDARAEPALMVAIKDPETEVRKQALWALGHIDN